MADMTEVSKNDFEELQFLRTILKIFLKSI